MSELDTAPHDICSYGAGVLTTRLERMLEYQEGVRRNEDTEAVHQMRVWSRRTRAALDVFAPCFLNSKQSKDSKQGKEYRALMREVKAITSALGAARDMDVMIAGLEKRAAGLPESQRPGVSGFIAHLKTRRAAAQEELERAMIHLLHSDLSGRLAHLLKKAGEG